MTTKTILAPSVATETVSVGRQITVTANALSSALVDRYNGDALVEHIAISAGTSVVFGEYFALMQLKISAITGTVTTSEGESNQLVDYPVGVAGGITLAQLDDPLSYTAYNGWIGSSTVEADSQITSDGTTVTLSIQKTGGGNLDVMFSGGTVTVICIPALTISLTTGSNASPQINYIYISKAAPTVITKSLTGFPTAEEYIAIGKYLVPSASFVQTYGLLLDKDYDRFVWNGTTELGHVAHVCDYILAQHASWISGCLLTPTLTTATTPDTLTISIASGTVNRMHEHAFPAFNSATIGATNLTTFFAINHPTAYTSGKDLCTANFLQTSAGVAVSNNSRISWVVWGTVDSIVNSKVFVNLPSGFYNSDANAIADTSKFTNYAIPSEYKGTGFLIAKLTYQVTNANSGTYALTLVENIDLRGQIPSVVAGGSIASSTVFPDNVFVIQDEADSTKHVHFSVGGSATSTNSTIIATATVNRDYTLPDVSGTFAMVAKTASIITTSTTLTAADDGKIIVISGINIDITLPASSAVSTGWTVTLVNENSTNVATAHTSSGAQTPIGQSNVRILRSGSDTMDGLTTNFHGASAIITPRDCVDIWKVSGTGFQGSPSRTVGWRDNPTSPFPLGVNANDPAESAIDSSFMRAYEFTNAVGGSEKEIYYNIHINHDYVMGTRIYPHVHGYIGNTTATTVVGFGFQHAAVKGHQQAALSLAGTTVYASATLTGTAYTHYLIEVSDANAIPATNLEPDTVVSIRCFRDSANAGGSGDTATTSFWVTFVDCHYLSADGGTPNKSPPFHL